MQTEHLRPMQRHRMNAFNMTQRLPVRAFAVRAKKRAAALERKNEQ